jgi:hypothetical protein
MHKNIIHMITMLIIIHSFVQVLLQLQGFSVLIPLSCSNPDEMAQLMLIIKNLNLDVDK